MTIPPDHLELVLAHMRGRQRSQASPATGLYWMSDEHFRACIGALRDQGHNIAEVTVAGGDLAANETGYLLIEGVADPAYLDTLRNRAAHLRARLDDHPTQAQQARSTPPRDHERGVDVHVEEVATVDVDVGGAGTASAADIGV